MNYAAAVLVTIVMAATAGAGGVIGGDIETMLLNSGTVGVLGLGMLILLRYVAREHIKAMDRQTKTLSMVTASVIAMEERLMIHDAQVRGINPSAGEDVDERAALAVKTLNSQRRHLRDLHDAVVRGTSLRSVGDYESGRA